MSLSMSGDTAATITAIGTLLTVIGNLVMQIIQAKRSAANGRKVDENTTLTKVTAAKVEEIHQATTAIAQTGSYPVIK